MNWRQESICRQFFFASYLLKLDGLFEFSSLL